jgi:Skp family chaperone for outer membrane proteins
MLSRCVLFVTVPTAFSLLIAPGASGQARCPDGPVAIVQLRTIYASIDRYAAKDTVLSTLIDTYKTAVMRLNGEIDSTTRSYQDKTNGISASARQFELHKLDGQVAQIQQRKVVLQQELSRQRDFLMQPIEIGVQSVLDSVRRELKCAAVFDASSARGIASVNRGTDITQRVIDRIKTTGDTAIFGPHPVVTGRP